MAKNMPLAFVKGAASHHGDVMQAELHMPAPRHPLNTMPSPAGANSLRQSPRYQWLASYLVITFTSSIAQ
jgi:hypothetical protein